MNNREHSSLKGSFSIEAVALNTFNCKDILPCKSTPFYATVHSGITKYEAAILTIFYRY